MTLTVPSADATGVAVVTEQQPEAPAVPEEEIVTALAEAAKRTKAVPSRWRVKAPGDEIEAMQLTHASGPQVWEWADSKPTYGTDGFVDGLAVYTRNGRVVARYGMWVVRQPDGFEVWDDTAFRSYWKPADDEAARIASSAPVFQSPAPVPAETGEGGAFRRRSGDQHLPVPNDGPSMHDLAAEDVRRRHPGGRAPEIRAVIRDLAARKQLGLNRYGSLLQARNGRDALRDLSEELLDAIVYCKQWLEENDEEHPHAAAMRQVYRDLLTDVLTVRRVVGAEGDGHAP